MEHNLSNIGNPKS